MLSRVTPARAAARSWAITLTTAASMSRFIVVSRTCQSGQYESGGMSAPEDHRASTEPTSAQQQDAAQRRLKRRIVMWYGVAALGLVASLISYPTTAPGGSYVV